MRDDTRNPPDCKLTGARCRCSACGERFNATSTFDAHRIGGYEARRCLTCAEMTARGWLRNSAGFWITGAKPPRAWAIPRRSGDRHRPATWAGGAA